MKKTEQTSNFKGILLKMAIGALIGALLGGIFGYFYSGHAASSTIRIPQTLLHSIQSFILPGLIVITVLTVTLQEIFYARLKNVCARLADAEDEEFDALDYEEERIGSILQLINILSQVLSIILLSFGYSFDYLKNLLALTACLIFVACFVYDGLMQTRYVKLLQQTHPEKRGDVSSKKFHQQWLDSCDEAEQEIIYRSAYKAYISTSYTVGLLLVLTMVAHLLFHTGILAIIVVGVIYLILTTTYLKSCLDLKKKKLLR